MSYINIIIYYIGYIITKDLSYVKSSYVDPLCFIIDKADGTLKKAMGIDI